MQLKLLCPELLFSMFYRFRVRVRPCLRLAFVESSAWRDEHLLFDYFVFLVAHQCELIIFCSICCEKDREINLCFI